MIYYLLIICCRSTVGRSKSTSLARSCETLKVYPLFAQWAFEFLFQPEIDALTMELVGAGECFDHLSTLQVIEANSTAVFLLLWARG